MVEQEVKLDGAFDPSELRPVEPRRAQIDDGGIEAHELILEPELPPTLGERPAALQELVEDVFEQLPRALGVGQALAYASVARDGASSIAR